MQITNTQDLLQNYAYQNDFTFFESSTPQTTLLYLKANGVYQVSFVGGGGGADGGSKVEWACLLLHANVDMTSGILGQQRKRVAADAYDRYLFVQEHGYEA